MPPDAAARRAPRLRAPGRFAVRDRIVSLDPERDHQQIVRLTGMVEFPWDTARALEFALFRTFASPRISGLLARTGEFTARPQRRYDDTDLLIAEFVEHGYDSPRGRRAIARMNAIHGRFRIRNVDYLYVLSTFTFEPQRWITRFGWRAPTEGERQAAFVFWREVGDRMGIEDLPSDRASFERFNRDYEDAHFRYARSNEIVGRATRDLFLSWMLPAPLRPLGARGVHAMMDAPLLDAFGFPQPTVAERRLVAAVMRTRARTLARMPPRRRPVWHTRQRRRSYPRGYTIEELGPPPSGLRRA